MKRSLQEDCLWLLIRKVNYGICICIWQCGNKNRKTKKKPFLEPNTKCLHNLLIAGAGGTTIVGKFIHQSQALWGYYKDVVPNFCVGKI